MSDNILQSNGYMLQLTIILYIIIIFYACYVLLPCALIIRNYAYTHNYVSTQIINESILMRFKEYGVRY